MNDAKHAATFLRKLPDWRGDARLYRLSRAVAFHTLDGEESSTEYVIVSAIDPVSLDGLAQVLNRLCGFEDGVPETFIFPATAEGSAVNHVQLAGSFQGGKDHAKALRDAGYEVAS